MDKKEIENYKKSGEIAKEIKKYAREIVKKGSPLLEIADKLEEKIIKLGGFPAFPVNLCINDIAAHSTPSYNSTDKAFGIIKIDIGVSVKGCITDTAITIDLENSDENKKLIQATDKALEHAIKTTKFNIQVNNIGKEIHKIITSFNLSPIRNLSGHSISQSLIHSGLTIPNYDNNNTTQLEEGIYAIEPFSTTGQGIVYEGKNSGIYHLKKRAGLRDAEAKKLLDFIEKTYSTLPFCERWLVKKFGEKIRFKLKLLEQADCLHPYCELIEKSHGKVSQSEHTLLITKDKVEILT